MVHLWPAFESRWAATRPENPAPMIRKCMRLRLERRDSVRLARSRPWSIIPFFEGKNLELNVFGCGCDWLGARHGVDGEVVAELVQ